MCAPLPVHSTTSQGHPHGGSPDAIRLVLRMAVRMTGAQGAMITHVRDLEHMPVISVDLSHLLAASIARQMSGQKTPEGTTLRLIQFRNRSPLFAICISPKPHWTVSFLMTEENSLDRCSLPDLELVASELTALLQPSSAVDIDLPLTACCVCENVQEDSGQWQPWQRFVEQSTGRMLSHTFCPRCLSTHYPEIVAAC